VSDTLLPFALRAVERVLCDHSRPHRETINLLWDILDDPHLDQAFGLAQNSQAILRPYLKRSPSGAVLVPAEPEHSFSTLNVAHLTEHTAERSTTCAKWSGDAALRNQSSPTASRGPRAVTRPPHRRAA